MLRRILSGFGANIFGQAVTIVIQIFSLPVFLTYWDLSTYGSWVVLSALPSFLSMADGGIVQAAGNEMTMALGRGDARHANRVFQSAQMVMNILCAALALILTPLILWAPFPDLVTWNQRWALVALTGVVLSTLYGGLPEAAFRATNRYPAGTMLSNLTRLAEWAGNVLGLVLWGTFAGVAFTGLAARLIGTVLCIRLAKTGDHSLFWGTKQAHSSEVLAMLRPALSFLAFPLSNALNFQGVTLVVGALFGTAAVALFTSYRTIARVAVQVTGMFSHALWPEFSRLFGHGGAPAIEKLFRHSAWIGALQSVGLSAVLYFAAPWLLWIWTHGRIEYVPSLMLWMLVYAAAGGIWHVPRILLMSTNQHIVLAGWSLAASGLGVLLAWIFGTAWQINGVAAAMLAAECFIAIICGYLALRLFHPALEAKGLIT